jgi:hypothetical protein
VAGAPFTFSPPIELHETAVRELCRLARKGYEVRNKRETYGFLFGVVTRTGNILVRHARYYRGGTRSRYGVSYPVADARRRRRELAQELHQRYVGSFHSHVEIGGRVSRGMSTEDRRSFRDDDMSAIEAVVFVWAGLKRTLRPSPRSIVAYEPDTGYHYRIRVYGKYGNEIRKSRVRVRRSGVVIVY